LSYRFNPFTGNLDLVGSGGSSSPDNFSYQVIRSSAVVEIPLGQEMLVSEGVQIDGELVLNGVLTILDLTPDSVCPLNPVPSGRKLSVFASEQCLIYDELIIDGEVFNDGQIILLPAS